MNSQEIKQAIFAELTSVIDPETGADVVKMRLVQDLNVSSEGFVTYVFRPSSPLCPLAVSIAMDIMQAISLVPGVTGQHINVADYVQAQALTETLNNSMNLSNQD